MTMSNMNKIRKVVEADRVAKLGRKSTFKSFGRNVVIVSAKRTPIACFNGSFASLRAPELGKTAVLGALNAIDLQPDQIDEVYFGNVLQAGVGQNPARQVAKGSGITFGTPCTTINKVCASGMKSVMLSAQAISLGLRDTCVAGGMESMSNAPHYMYLRNATPYGNSKVLDAIQQDGLTDAYDQELMGRCTEYLIEEMGITREDQDAYAITSYERAIQAQSDGITANEITPVEIKDRKGKTTTFAEDEECKRFMPDKFSKLNSAFMKNGTITAANASKINDGAAAVVMMEEEQAKALGLKPLARIVGYEDTEVEPYQFGVAPVKAINKLMQGLEMQVNDIDYFEINEAFSAVALASMELLNIDRDRINTFGGAVALGHPIGASGCRIIMSLITALEQRDGTLGMAAICNGGGGASAVLIERLK